ncbi:MAG: hypothetical protein ACLUEQ_13320 [Cloacibacillus evryensis]
MDGEKVLSFVEENDIKFVRLFSGIFGRPKSIAVMSTSCPGSLKAALALTPGDRRLRISQTTCPPSMPRDLLRPAMRPAMGGVARMFCDIRHAGGAPFEGDGRFLLRSAVERAALAGQL